MKLLINIPSNIVDEIKQDFPNVSLTSAIMQIVRQKYGRHEVGGNCGNYKDTTTVVLHSWQTSVKETK